MARIIQTSTLSSATLEGLLDELEQIKLAAYAPPGTIAREDTGTPGIPSKEFLKRLLKAGGLAALGYTSGYGTGQLLDKALEKVYMKFLQQHPPAVSAKYLQHALGALGAGLGLAHMYTEYKKSQEMNKPFVPKQKKQ